MLLLVLMATIATNQTLNTVAVAGGESRHGVFGV